MKLSSLDIRKQEFTRVVRGYDKEEVDAFLQLAANQWQEIVDDLRREEDKVKELNVKLEHYQKVEEALEEALKTARDGAKKTVENAEHKAQLIVEQAEGRSVDITREAETERLSIRKDAAKYSVRQKEIVAKLRAFLMSELEILAQYESEAPVNYIKLKAAEISEFVSQNSEDASPAMRSYEEIDEPVKAQGESDLDYYDDSQAEEIYEEDEEDMQAEFVAEIAAEDTELAEVAHSEAEISPEPQRARGKLKEAEVSDEIEKIRRILEDLEK